MGANPNTMTIQAIWSKQYQISHLLQPVYRAFADERGENELTAGDTYHRTAVGDFIVNNMGGNGSYSTQALVDTDQTLTVNVKKEVSFQVPAWQKAQFHLPVISEYGNKAMFRIWNNVDAQLLYDMTIAAAQVVDDGTLGGTAGNPIAVSADNALAIYLAAQQALQFANVKYVPGKQMMPGVKNYGAGPKMSVAAISPQLYLAATNFAGAKNSAAGDKAMMSAYLGYFAGFNNMVSNNLTYEAVIKLPTNPSDGDTITFLNGVSTTQFGVTTSQAVTLTFRTSTTAAAGEIKAASTAALTAANLAAALSAPTTVITNGTNAGYTPPTILSTVAATTFTATIAFSLAVGTVDATTNTTVHAYFPGVGNFPTVAVFTSGNNSIAQQIQHNLFGTSSSISLIMQKKPGIFENAVSGQVARDYVIWNLWGRKVFNDQALQLIDVRLDASKFTATNLPTLVTA